MLTGRTGADPGGQYPQEHTIRVLARPGVKADAPSGRCPGLLVRALAQRKGPPAPGKRPRRSVPSPSPTLSGAVQAAVVLAEHVALPAPEARRRAGAVTAGRRLPTGKRGGRRRRRA